VINGRKNLSKYNILEENDHAPPQVNAWQKLNVLIS
jgi:hypothetical protein